MLKVGLTGGIASGKSTVGGMFSVLGAHIIQADVIAHQLMQPGEKVYDEVVRHFGGGILDPDGTINRPRLAELAFSAKPRPAFPRPGIEPNRPSRRNTRAGGVDGRGWKKRSSGNRHSRSCADPGGRQTPRFDRLVVVACGPEQRIARWARKQNVDPEIAGKEVERRMAAQLPDEEKIRAAHYVIDNSGSLHQTEEQVRVDLRPVKARGS